jgi:choline-phosphate cytidylyltransferase
MIQSYMVKTGWTRFGCMASLGMRFVPALLLQLLRNSDSDYQLTSLDVICDGLFLTVLTSDLTLAKMARRELHPWVVLMSLAAVLSHSVILILVATYYIAVFADLCFYLNLPLLATCRNVYCDGVYDLCHIGHKRAFQNALSLGNRLLVGVVGDQDASSYKRPPIMTHAERCQEVQACKAVSKVIPNAPCFGLTQEFLDEHQLHIVAFGEEYLEKYPDPRDDPYYGYVRAIGIARPLPRTNTLSTTDLINRILKAGVVDKRSPT